MWNSMLGLADLLSRFARNEIVCEKPLLTIDKQIGVNVVHPDGRVGRDTTYFPIHEADDVLGSMPKRSSTG